VSGSGVSFRRRKSPFVDLTVTRNGQGINEHVSTRHHRLRQPASQVRTQLLHFDSLLVGCNVTDQVLVRPTFLDNDPRLPYRRQRLQCSFDLLELSGLLENQYIEIYSVTNGERFATYVIKAPRGSGTISLNGAAARKAMVGDKLIIAAYSQYTESELQNPAPIVVLVDERNCGRLKGAA
jgi:aspartate 1-decarboxylase